MHYACSHAAWNKPCLLDLICKRCSRMCSRLSNLP